jgi:hypothetical protein
MTLHETGHFVTAMIVGAKEISLHHNYVISNSDNLTLTARIFEKTAGPIVSLIIGILFHIISLKQKKQNMLFVFNLYI